MADDYTPTREEVRGAYASDYTHGPRRDAQEAEFERWLSQHDAALRAELAEYERVVGEVYSLLAPVGRQGRVYMSEIKRARVLISSLPPYTTNRESGSAS